MDKKTEIAIKLLSQNKPVNLIAKEIKLSRWGTYLLFKSYIDKHSNSTYCDKDFLFKKIKENNKEEVLKRNLTKLGCKDKYYVYKEFIFDAKIKPTTNSSVPLSIKNITQEKGLPLSIDILLDSLNIKRKFKKQFYSFIDSMFSENIVIFQDNIISIKSIKAVVLIEKTIQFANTMEELYQLLMSEAQTAKILKNSNINSFLELQKLMKRHRVNDEKLIHTCDGRYEIKPKINSLNETIVEKIIEESLKITDSFACGFHIDILYEKIKEKIDININIKEFKTILINSGSFRHYKASMIVQNDCNGVISNPEFVYSVLSNTPTSIEELILLLKEKGRFFTKLKLVGAITTLKNTEGVSIKTKKAKVSDKSFEAKTKHKRNIMKTYYYK